jgi:predicted dehydrogenase
MGAKIRYGMVGGGEGAFIGAVHRAAAQLDSTLELVCGAFSSDAKHSRRFGEGLGLDPARCYPDYETMLSEESKHPTDTRMEFVSIVTPNDLHFPISTAALEAGFDVLCDKPATLNLAQCQDLAVTVERSGRLFGLTHPYAFYPMITEARDRVAAGQLGAVRKVIVEYVQGWLAEPVEHLGNKQAEWRLDPARSGSSGAFGDIGVHAFHLAELVTDQSVVELGAELNRIVEGRPLDDDGTAWLRFDGGAHGVLIASQICTGEENDLRLRVYGDEAALDWRQQEPNSLWLKYPNGASECLRTGRGYLGGATAQQTRLPAGHPEGYIEAFANLYRTFAVQVREHGSGKQRHDVLRVPGIGAALRGMAFIEAVVAASASAQKWHAFPKLER